MKKIELKIKYCSECPYLRSYTEWPGFYCSIISAFNGHEDIYYTDELGNRAECKSKIKKIHEFCPLKDTI